MTEIEYKQVGTAKKSRFGTYLKITIGDQHYSICVKDMEEEAQCVGFLSIQLKKLKH